MSRKSHRVAVAVLQSYLSQFGVTHVPDKLGRIASKLCDDQPFDVFANVEGTPTLALAVRSAKIKGLEKWSSTTHTYLSQKKLSAMEGWVNKQQVPFEAHVVYVMEATRPAGPPLFAFDGRQYQLVTVPPSEVRANMQPRASRTWDKVQVSSAVFERIAVPLDRVVRKSGEDAA